MGSELHHVLGQKRTTDMEVDCQELPNKKQAVSLGDKGNSLILANAGTEAMSFLCWNYRGLGN